MKRSRTLLIAALPFSVCPLRVAAAVRRRRRSPWSLLRCRSRLAASFDPLQWRFCWATGRIEGVDDELVEELPQPATAAQIKSASSPRSITGQASYELRSDAAELRDDLVAVRLERLFLAVRHQ